MGLGAIMAPCDMVPVDMLHALVFTDVLESVVQTGNWQPVIVYCLSNDVILVRQASEQNDRILNAIRYFLYG